MHGISLEYVIINGHTETMWVLLQAGADVHAEGGMPLFCALINNRKEKVQILLQAGAYSSKISLSLLKKFLTPKFLLSLSEDVLLRIENEQRELKEKIPI